MAERGKGVRECNRWLANSSVNPATGKTIKEGAKVWTTLKEMCKDVAAKRGDNNGEFRISVKNAETREKVKGLLRKDPRNNWKVTSRTNGAYIIVINNREEREEALRIGEDEALVMDLKQFNALVVGGGGGDDNNELQPFARNGGRTL